MFRGVDQASATLRYYQDLPVAELDGCKPRVFHHRERLSNRQALFPSIPENLRWTIALESPPSDVDEFPVENLTLDHYILFSVDKIL